jgi:hypothetical protein
MAKIKQNCDGITEIVHAPGAILDYGFNWSSWLQAGETIVSSTWTIDPTLVLSSSQNVSGVTSTFVNGGTLGSVYTLINTITTSNGRVDSRALILSCQNKGNY